MLIMYNISKTMIARHMLWLYHAHVQFVSKLVGYWHDFTYLA
jgi:hypothetical protein